MNPPIGVQSILFSTQPTNEDEKLFFQRLSHLHNGSKFGVTPGASATDSPRKTSWKPTANGDGSRPCPAATQYSKISNGTWESRPLSSFDANNIVPAGESVVIETWKIHPSPPDLWFTRPIFYSNYFPWTSLISEEPSFLISGCCDLKYFAHRSFFQYFHNSIMLSLTFVNRLSKKTNYNCTTRNCTKQ